MLELAKTRVERIELGRENGLAGGVLGVDVSSLESVVRRAAPQLSAIRFHVAHPGESIRLACVKDVIEPRRKLSGDAVGEGRVRVLDGMAVATCGRVVGFQEGLVDMAGPGARHSPFSELALLVLEIDVAEGTPPHVHEAALRAAGLAAAEHLASLPDAEPQRVERVDWSPAAPGLPRVAYLYLLLSQGLLHDSWVEGRNATEGLPRVVDPRLPLEGGIVSGNCVSACDKNTTWHHQNNAVVHELLRRHGRELALVGCVLSNEPVRLADKQAAARSAVTLIRGLGAEGVVISKEGFGNPDADLMMLVRGLEQQGIRTVAISDEFAGRDGASQSLADTTPEADAVVSVGNANETLVLPPLERCIGPAPQLPLLAGVGAGSGGGAGEGSLEVELQVIVGSTNQIGAGRLTARGL